MLIYLPATNTLQQTFDNGVQYQSAIIALYTKSNEHLNMQELVKGIIKQTTSQDHHRINEVSFYIVIGYTASSPSIVCQKWTECWLIDKRRAIVSYPVPKDNTVNSFYHSHITTRIPSCM
jgi:hypothetical protein